MICRAMKNYSQKQQALFKIILSCTMIVCLLSLIIISSKSQSVLDFLNLAKSEIKECSITVLGQSSISTDLGSNELEKTIEILDATNIRFEKIEFNMTVPMNTTKYLLLFQAVEGKTAKIVVCSHGYVFIDKCKYKILRGEEQNILEYLNCMMSNMGSI